MKKIIYLSILLLVAHIATCQKQKSEEVLEWIPFNWGGDSISGKYYSKGYMTIPVSLDNLPYNFNMQLDLGAITTEVCGNKIDLYFKKHPKLKSKISRKTYWNNSKKYPIFKNINLKLGKTSFGPRNIGYHKNYGDTIPEDSLYTKSEKHIGTIAPDIFKNKILIIDYKNSRIAVTKKLPDCLTNAQFQPCEIKEGRVNLLFTINGKQQKLLFDTGSSIFSLLTTREKACQISDGNIIDSLIVNSWNKYITVYGCRVASDVFYNQKRMKNTTVYYDKNNKFEYFYNKNKLWGITGNAYFLNNVIIIDYKKKLFGIM